MNKEDLLYRYFSNSLTPAQKMELDSLLKNEPEFLKQFTFEKDLQQSVKTKKNNELKSKLQEFEKELQTKKVSSKANYKIWAIAASIALLIGFVWFNSYHSSTDFDNLYASNFETYPNTVYSITRGDTINSLERKAFVAYEQGDFKTAQDYFITFNKQLKEEDLQKKYIDFYLALSYLNTNDDESAKDIFKTIVASKKQFTGEALWYLSLINLKEQDSKNAKKHLQQLINTESYNKERAIKLLKEIN